MLSRMAFAGCHLWTGATVSTASPITKIADVMSTKPAPSLAIVNSGSIGIRKLASVMVRTILCPKIQCMRDQNVAKKLRARDLLRGSCPVGRAPAPDRRGQHKAEEDTAQ